MADLRVVRGAFAREATFGLLVDIATETPFGVTLEPERDNNRPTRWNGKVRVRGGACIPAGRYRCRRTISPKFGETFEIEDVPNRSHILFHALNIDDETDGCIGLGDDFGMVKVGRRPAEFGIVRSRKAFDEFMERQRGVDTFWLTIVEAA